MKKLVEMVPNDFSYCISKIYEGIYNPYPLTKMNFESVESYYQDIKDDISSRFAISSRIGLADTIRRMDYILDRVKSWIDTGELLHNTDAEVFMDAFNAHWEKFNDMLIEIDNRGKKFSQNWLIHC